MVGYTGLTKNSTKILERESPEGFIKISDDLSLTLIPSRKTQTRNQRVQARGSLPSFFENWKKMP